RCGCRGESVMPQLDKFSASGVTLLGLGEDFLGLEVKKTHAHGAIAHDAFQVADAPASAKALLGIERDGDVSALPDPFDIRPAAIANAVADGPNAGEFIQLAARGGYPGSDRIGIVGNVNRRVHTFSA